MALQLLQQVQCTKAPSCTKAKADEELVEGMPSPVKTRRYLPHKQESYQKLCFFCEKEEFHTNVNESFQLAKSSSTDKKVWDYAKRLRDTRILVKLADRDMTAQDAVYHLSCLSSYYYKGERSQAKPQVNQQKLSFESQVLAELVSYIEDSKQQDNISV